MANKSSGGDESRGNVEKCVEGGNSHPTYDLDVKDRILEQLNV